MSAKTPRPADMRARARERRDPFDIVIVGAGATGLGAAVDAATRGHSVCVVERGDIGQGTSTRSTKLVHGGVRYLRQGRVALVREGLVERGRLLANAPHVVQPIALVAPARTAAERALLWTGLTLYDALAGRRRLGRSRALSRADLGRTVPGLAAHRFAGGVAFQDGQFDDARLLVALARTAVGAGASLLLRCPVEGVLHDRAGRVAGLAVRDVSAGASFEVRARAVLNAAGPWSDAVRALDSADASPRLAPSSGVHVVLPAEFLPGRTGVLLPETSDGRVLFALPFWDRVLVGTTDVPVAAVPDEPLATAGEIDFLLASVGEVLARAPRRSDVTSSWSGLRPLLAGGAGRKSSRLSRDFAIERSQSGMLTIAGGKWTSYRRMAEAAVDRLEREGALGPRPSRTAALRLAGASERASTAGPGHHGPFGSGARFAHHGTDAPRLEALVAGDPALGRPLHDALDLCGAEIVHAVHEEFAETVEDVLARRSRALLLDAAAARAVAPAVAHWIERAGGDPASVGVATFDALAARFVPG